MIYDFPAFIIGIQVKRQPTVILTANDNCNVLQPYIGNFHAIHAVEYVTFLFIQLHIYRRFS